MPYIPFITCDDPKGVVECGAYRKHRSSNRKTDRKTETQKGKEVRECSDTEENMERGRVREKSHANFVSSMQLLKISRGVQKLNMILESWARGQSYVGQSKDVAKDLLRSALDLQESLGSLGRLQEASEGADKGNKKLKEKNEERRIHDLRIKRSMSERVGEQNYRKNYEKPRLSADKSSRDCHEELRRVIRESFARQNLLPYPEEKARSSGGNAESSYGMASTSSSQFSTAHGNGSTSSKSSLSSATPPRSSKGPNLIARLMGYESRPPELITSNQKSEPDMILSPRRPAFEIDKPKKPRKPSLVAERGFKAFRRSSLVKDLDSESCQSNDIDSNTSATDGPKPIVLIKPRPAPYREPEMIQEGKPLHTKSIACRESRRISEKTGKKTELGSDAIKRLSKNKSDRDPKATLAIAEEQESKDKGLCKTRHHGSLNNLTPEERVDEKVGKGPTEMIATRKLEEKDAKGFKNGAKVTPTKPGRSTEEPNVAKNQSASLKTYVLKSNPTRSQGSFGQQRSPVWKQNPRSEPVKSTIEKKEHQGEDTTEVDCSPDKSFSSVEDTSRLMDHFALEDETQSSQALVGDQSAGKQSSLSDSHSQDVNNLESIEEVSRKSCSVKTPPPGCNAYTSLKSLLMSSRAFLDHAENLFGLETSVSTSPQEQRINDLPTSNRKLFIDCATELMERKKFNDLHTQPMELRIHHVSLDELFRDVHKTFEALRRYSEASSEDYVIERISAMLEKDLRTKSKLASGIWSVGWIRGFSVDDTEQVVIEVERLIFGGLMEEMLT